MSGVTSTEECLRQRELEETKARAAQMEKTMKWWSECTASWREKWIKVRNERNVARDEAKQLRANLEAAMKETNSHKREKGELELQIGQLKKEMEKVHLMLIKHAGQFDRNAEGSGAATERNIDGEISPDLSSSDGLKRGSLRDSVQREDDGLRMEDIDLNKDQSAEERRLIQQLSKDTNEDVEDRCTGSATILQIRLEDLQRTMEMEREEKLRLARELQEVLEKCDELRTSKQDAIRELLTIQEQHRAELRISGNALQEEINAREAGERRLSELRGELERLQAENTMEWEKRERLETNKLGLERDNKKLRGEVRDLQDRLERRGRGIPCPSGTDPELRVLQQELVEKNKEISEIKHSHNKMKKLLAEANTEMGHALRRADQYETEVKRLRARVEELKRDLAGAEDELDAACNQVRRLRRTNEDLDADNSRQRLSAPINLVTEQKSLRQYQPSFKADDASLSESMECLERNSHLKYSL